MPGLNQALKTTIIPKQDQSTGKARLRMYRKIPRYQNKTLVDKVQ